MMFSASVTPSLGRMLDDDIGFDAGSIDASSIELDIPQIDTPPPTVRVRADAWPARPPAPRPMLPPPSGDATSSAPAPRRAARSLSAVDTRGVIEAFAGFGARPTSIWETPAYALRVVSRRYTLQRQLEVARRHRAADVGLYESALQVADGGAVVRGFATMAAIVALSGLLALALVAVIAIVA